MLDVAIIGGGISGLTAAYQAQRRNLSYRVFEASERWGGAVHTINSLQGLEEAGPETLVGKPQVLELCRELGLEDQWIPASKERPLVLKDKHLLPLPEGFRRLMPSGTKAVFQSPLLTNWGRMRLLMEPFVGQPKGEESVADFIRRRLGEEVLEWMVQPIVTGIYGADPEQLSMESTFPSLLKREQEYRSLYRSFQKSPPKEATLLGFRQGLSHLVLTLRQKLKQDWLHLNSPVMALTPCGQGEWHLQTKDQRVRARHVLIALPAPTTSALIQSFAPEMAALIRPIIARDVAVLCQAWPKNKIQVPEGGSLLVPLSQGLAFSSCTMAHLKWPGRSPWDVVTIRLLLGGAGREELLHLSDAELTARAQKDLQQLMPHQGKPLKSVLVRHPQRLPEYAVGHRQRIADLLELNQAHPTLHLAGNWLDGVGVADCILRAIYVSRLWKRVRQADHAAAG
jgi:oxygen-dependent protoporphyrinogen oxidase